MTVSITTTGATFSPVVALVAGSTATVTWSCPGFTSQTGVSPSFSFGSAATRTVTMTVTGGGGNADVTLFNLGYDDTVDVGNYMPPSAYNKAAEAVSGVSGINTLTGLIYFLADRTALAGPMDFTGMTALQFIQCFTTNITGVTLTGCTALKRLQVEACNLTTLDLNPVAGNLYDLRAAAQQGGALSFAALTSPMAVEYHYCVRDQVVTGELQGANLPAVFEDWIWNSHQGGQYKPASTALKSVIANLNQFTAADLTNQFPAGRNGGLDLHGCQLTSAILTGCPGLTTIDLSDNRLAQAAVDSVLATVAGWGTSGGTLDLRYNTAPSAAGTANANTLTGRTWTVNTDVPTSLSVVQTATSNFTFPAGVATGDTVILVVCAYGAGTAMSSSSPQYNSVTPPGTVLLKEILSATVGGFNSYVAIWMMPHCGNGSALYAPPAVSGASATWQFAFDVAGLGVTPVLDRTSAGSGSGTAMDSGATQPIRSSAELIIAAAQTFAGSAAAPGAPWTTIPNGSNAFCGYQIASAAGGTYDWLQTASGSGQPWAAEAVTITPALPASGGLLLATFP